MNKYQSDETIKGDSLEDTEGLRAMARNAREYLRSFEWCPAIKNVYLTYGIGYVIGVFLIELSQEINAEGDSWLWVICGDLPSAYMVCDNIDSPRTAVERYCDLMDDWAEAVVAKKNLDSVFPVQATPTLENGEALLKRTRYLRENIIPQIEK